MSYSKVDVRLARDIEMLLNSPFWIESLRNGHARGISQQLNREDKINEITKLVKDFFIIN